MLTTSMVYPSTLLVPYVSASRPPGICADLFHHVMADLQHAVAVEECREDEASLLCRPVETRPVLEGPHWRVRAVGHSNDGDVHVESQGVVADATHEEEEGTLPANRPGKGGHLHVSQVIHS